MAVNSGLDRPTCGEADRRSMMPVHPRSQESPVEFGQETLVALYHHPESASVSNVLELERHDNKGSARSPPLAVAGAADRGR